ncbi:ATP-binding protein [Aequorivita viscosa]|uniref:Histidine kinase-, DNA gyrase B-, and HSP90-like ATPase n=1 Tax=Aequorivita viscosa TaxID=797419 RepID=A0A1M6P449_9FLAO|nr:ATP-binding protein [Aequorivita viscosa]SDX51824.1 Histidine kinase-, DNA gyrase B-, and HSP90-like ATPase [Aequorivita viscosa]SHK02666.1 Histidine kinase-, DNA gyrase B-, and HSP90-like ATPase [Aequorivita viscosa]
MQFRTKARAVDLLGKGQIADLPTAITELWKNGYDAYADNLKAELFKKGYNGLTKSYFTISDDGKGMSNSDILDKWLVLGTDSKSRAETDIESEDTLWKRPRIKAGEKGIGRLSVAYLGNPMLMLTKKIGYPLQALFFDWRLLENYNLFLDDINIPLKSVEKLNTLESIFADLKNEFLLNFEKETDLDNKPIWEGKQIELKSEIVTNTKEALLEAPVLDKIFSFFNSDDSHGTLFLTFNPINQILELAENDNDGLEDRKFVISSLTGFTNPFKDIKIDVSTIFNINKGIETYDLLNSRGNFFTKSDFDLADVYIKGEFNGNGTFEGKIRIYNEIIDYSYTNPRKKDKRSFYGAIPLELGYSQGEEKSSSLTESQFAGLFNKVREYGGLYIFRDNFRVLPYGRENADFLNFEQRRSKRAGTYYFSYRRMYGYLDITRERNEHLKDKSSREGLINNAQYRAFTNDAINFFVTLAQDYFGTEAKQSIFLDKKKELNDQHEALKADKAREKAEKIAFTKSLNAYPQKLDEHQNKYRDLLNILDEKLNNINVTYSEVESILDELQKMDLDFKALIPKVPKHYKPTETQKERLYKFEDKLNNYFELIKPKRDELNKKAQDKLEIRDLKIDFSKKYNGYIFSLEKALNENRQQLDEKFTSLSKEYRERSKRLINSLSENKERVINEIFSKEQVNQFTNEIEMQYNSLFVEAERKLFPLVNHIKRLKFEINQEEVEGAYKAQYDQMKYQWEQTRDTAQLGIAVEIIDHEFNQLYAKINNQLGVLGNNEVVNSIKEFRFLEKNFKQLEDKYALLSPLYRISGALIKDISCNKIFNYLLEFFENQILEYNIYFDVSDNFRNHIINIKEPVIHTVFINIINNAIYWLRNKEQRVIKLDYLIDTQEIIIANSGEKIPDYRLDKIFDLFYSQRPNGRGIGLYLSKQSLNEAGLDIYATNDVKYNSLKGACFVINKKVN